MRVSFASSRSFPCASPCFSNLGLRVNFNVPSLAAWTRSLSERSRGSGITMNSLQRWVPMSIHHLAAATVVSLMRSISSSPRREAACNASRSRSWIISRLLLNPSLYLARGSSSEAGFLRASFDAFIASYLHRSESMLGGGQVYNAFSHCASNRVSWVLSRVQYR
jgi:hypothetical protein